MATVARIRRLWSALRVILPKIPSPPRFWVRQLGPRSVQVRALADPNEPPTSWPGTQPEWWAYQWLIRRGLRENIDFHYQVTLSGGRRQLFGNIVDFIISSPIVPAIMMVWRIQGYYWHLAQGHEVIANDLASRLRLEQHGWLVIDILDKDLEDPQQRDDVLSNALIGIETLENSVFIFQR